MKIPRERHCAFKVDNSIYVCGGIDRGYNRLSSVEQFIVNDSRGWIELPQKMRQKRFILNSDLLLIFLLDFIIRTKQIKHLNYI